MLVPLASMALCGGMRCETSLDLAVVLFLVFVESANTEQLVVEISGEVLASS